MTLTDWSAEFYGDLDIFMLLHQQQAEPLFSPWMLFRDNLCFRRVIIGMGPGQSCRVHVIIIIIIIIIVIVIMMMTTTTMVMVMMMMMMMIIIIIIIIIVIIIIIIIIIAFKGIIRDF